MKVSKTAIFLFELMFVILIFTVSAAICTNIFAEAHALSSDSKALTMAVLKAESAAEVFKADVTSAGGGSLSEVTSAGISEQYYDEDWKETSKDQAYYTVSLTGEAPVTDGLQRAKVSVDKTAKAGSGEGDPDKTIYSIEVLAYGGK
jgi:hypothetical protein